MMTKRKLYLLLAGVILAAIGGYIAFTPVVYLAQFDFAANNVAMLSELRGMGGTLFIFGLFVLAGAVFKALEQVSLIVAALIFVSFSLFRLLGIVLDGVPTLGIAIALLIELGFAAAVIAMLWSSRAPRQVS